MSTLTRLKVYRRHHCERQHRTYEAFAKCVWPSALYVWCRHEEGTETPYALVIRCVKRHETWAPPRVRLWATQEAAELQATAYCGGGCYYAHEVIRLEME
ncbi:hypothetical protein [Streptomyces sp. NPDC007940]|uniref:hypothetical protein n=1 Tax=Streptomyces sp. NPDC007940 TaxID=3364796 RepID=UPI0036EC9630